MSKLAIIGNPQLLNIPHFECMQRELKNTPYGKPSAALQHGLLQGREVVLLARNGDDGKILPHLINYCANIWALQAVGVDTVVSFSLATGIRADMIPGRIVIPDQLIDYTHSRKHTFFSEDLESSRHIDFRFPYSAKLRRLMTEVGESAEFDCAFQATVGVTQGPRLETLAEINRLERDGCDLVGMTAMPETILARELQLHYASLVLIANKAAGRNVGKQVALDQIGVVLKSSVEVLHLMVSQIVLNLD